MRILIAAVLSALIVGCGAGTTDAGQPQASTPSQLVFSIQPAAVTGGTTMTPGVSVSITDANGRVVSTATNPVTIALSRTGSPLRGTTTVAGTGGVARFADLRVEKVGEYQLIASSPGLTSATSTQFSVSAGPAAFLAFGVPAATIPVGAVATFRVIVTDSGGNLATTANNTITLALNPSGSAEGVRLRGTLTAAAVSGEATFPDLTIDRAGVYSIRATSPGLLATVSRSFEVTAVPGSTSRAAVVSEPR